MFYENYYIDYSNKFIFNSISSYKKIMNKFIIKFIENKKIDNNTNFDEIYSDSLIYSRYYLYWKIYGCIYSTDIMNILFDIEFIC